MAEIKTKFKLLSTTFIYLMNEKVNIKNTNDIDLTKFIYIVLTGVLVFILYVTGNVTPAIAYVQEVESA
jgi:hypothetical protein